MTDKERLTKVLESAIAEFVVCSSDGEPVTSYPAKMVVEDCESLLAGHLIANGVTIPVPCKDCAVPHNKWTGCPKLSGLVPPPDFYCAYGERKDDG